MAGSYSLPLNRKPPRRNCSRIGGRRISPRCGTVPRGQRPRAPARRTSSRAVSDSSLTSEGNLGEAGQKLEDLKSAAWRN